jgi:hypothetical protein
VRKERDVFCDNNDRNLSWGILPLLSVICDFMTYDFASKVVSCHSGSATLLNKEELSEAGMARN